MLAAWLVPLAALMLGAFVQEPEYTAEQISARVRQLQPQPSDFLFAAPEGWSRDLVRSGRLVSAVPANAARAAEAAVDGDNYSLWEAPLGPPSPELLVDLGQPVAFDKVVVFNRATFNRGSGGGNNAVRRLDIYTGSNPNGTLTHVGEYDIDGPAPICFKLRGGGQHCTFIDRREPTVLSIPRQKARYVRLRLLEAHWSDSAPPEWKDKVAVSEVMLFNSEGPAR